MNVRQYGRLLLTLIVMSVWAVPISAQDDSHTVMYDHIRFSFPSSLATGVQIETIADNPLTLPQEQFSYEHYPKHLRFNFLNYLDGSEFSLPHIIAGPQILVYSTESMREFGYDFSGEFDALETLLHERPDLSPYAGASVREFEMQLPFLPWNNASQMLRSHPQYVEIAGVGSGIRYVTYYSQDADYITDRQLFYTFQGIMDSGTHYVSASFPVKTGVLPETVDTSDIDWDAFAANYSKTYLPQTFAEIDTLPDEAFTPSLPVLDTLVQSITFDPGTTGWQTYTDVLAAYSIQLPADHQICVLENTIEFIPGGQSYDTTEQDRCALSYQANPIAVIASTNDDSFQAFRQENYSDSFIDYQEETILIHDRQATRISGKEVETGLRFQLVRIEYDDSYLIFKALEDENITILNQMVASLRFLPQTVARDSH